MPAVLARFQWQVLATPLPGVRELTDAHSVAESRGALTALLIDGHGQGQSALATSRTALAAVRPNLDQPPAIMFARTHGRLLDTPGVSLVCARISAAGERLDFCGIGRLHAVLVARSRVVSLASVPGVLGVGRSVPPRPLVLPWTRESLLVLASDGLVDRWDLGRVHCFARAPLAEVVRGLIQPFQRVPEDVTLIVIRES